ncbi:GDSL-like Lipase/Acylhydrolase family protein [Sphingomonas sp. S17]|uniref:DNA, contig: SP629 n=2 Tax=Sphingomonas paucimobilis TaxID=13689 RepID=A0A0C9NGJ9_SPHPI|nr:MULTISPECIES: SGNH/GDSL hydrolase family protein [Sphingomonas]EGI53639.1 GDSL-like Lipase/Acylhydrolase family protein [Sphingomonas sp. S17]MCM3680566.1 SGNH/GDSL hydrolase family protein [Sphingomonas paucimobilis]MDG5970007.1 SGNH/GDSL hydrolase family protein [Sphingomonas paucimobilis]SUJ32581.1 GDSL-like Lipase/Acylhydrolase [Sphingomonas paucimobilis]BCI71562.1 acylneuraminate cytidylyltransferase [Sphingomonas paucimobilis]
MSRLVLAALMALTFAAPASAQQKETDAQRWTREWEERLHNDFGYLARYRDDNAKLGAPVAGQPRVVFMGDSITEGWVGKMPQFFVPGRVGRGISGQTTSQMLLRFRQDVIDLHPAVVQIMAGTNDIAGNTGPTTDAQVQANIMSMVELAQAHGIRVILASIPPADHFEWKPGLKPAPRIAAMNAWLKDYAKRVGATYADYWSALHVGDALNPAFGTDGVHPNEAGYAAMAPVANAAIKQALAKPQPRRMR